MKYANAARVNKGRTGPKREDGIREDLHRKLRREPDPKELQFKMQRKKGYSDVSKKKDIFCQVKRILFRKKKMLLVIEKRGIRSTESQPRILEWGKKAAPLNMKPASLGRWKKRCSNFGQK